MGKLSVILCLLCLFSCLSSCWTYHLIMKSTLPHGTAIFSLSNFNIVLDNGKYFISGSNAKSGNHFPYEVDKHLGILSYVPRKYLHVHDTIQHKFNIIYQTFNNETSLNVTMVVKIVSSKKWQTICARNDNLTSMRPYQFSNAPVYMYVHTSLSSLIRFTSLQLGIYPSFLLSNSLCDCMFKNEPYLATLNQLQLKQFVWNCKSDLVYIPHQTVTYVVTSKVRKHQEKFIEHSFRRKRSSSDLIFFRNRVYYTEINENSPANSLVTTMQVYDKFDSDRPVTSGVTFSFQAMRNRQSLNMFSINPSTGEVRTKVVLDRESIPHHNFLVTAVRAGGNQASTKLTITVLDKNDMSPIFEQPSGYSVTIQENQPNQTQVLQIKAYDSDTGNNGRIRYSIVSSNASTEIFAIRPNGVLVVNGTVDHEMGSCYKLIVEASDYGNPPHKTIVPVTIKISDENDNYPQFSKSVYTFNVMENASVGKEVGRVVAKDKDDGANGQVTYSVISGNSQRKFQINSKTGVITVHSELDYEEVYNEGRGVYTLRIRASDNGISPLSNSTGIVKINVIDINDNSPYFYGSPYHFYVSENAIIGTKVGSVEAADQDHEENARITYSIPLVSSLPNLPFDINRSSGEITVVGPIDYEKIPQYNFTIRASDNGVPRRLVSTKVTVDVHDLNDNAPQFAAKRYDFRVSEDTYIGYTIARLKAQDPDKHASFGVTYHILSGNENKVFSIVTRNGYGIIKLKKLLDYNRQWQYILRVGATDGTLRSSTSVYVNVTDTNSHQPIFDKAAYVVHVSENIPIGDFVVRVHASDDDVGDNARITYCFTDKITAFKIGSQSGNITTTRSLDFEKRATIQLMVKAHDNGIPQKHDLAEVTIYVQDANDNAPVFDKPHYVASISEGANLQSQVVTIHATDKDSENNARIYYTFDNGNDGDGDFSISSHSGLIRTAKRLDRESIDRYELVAYAVDGGSPALSTSVTIVVNIDDVDDNPPTFLPNDTLTFKVKEDVPIGHVVATIHAVDPDLQSDSKIVYDLGHDPRVLRQWRLDPHSGQLYVDHPLDYEKKKVYTLIVTATSNELVNQATVKILVLDCNDNDPVFHNFEIIFNNYITGTKGSFPSGVIGRVPAYDPDVSDTLRYKFVSGNRGHLLLLNSTTGEMRLNKTLNGNRTFTTSMLMEVSDGERQTKAVCTLKVTGITDEMLQHSITVRVLHMNVYTFLSPVMYNFIDGLANILNTTSSHIYIFNVQNDTDVDREILNVSFSARQHDNSFFPSKILQDQVYLNREKLKKLTSKNVLPFDDNICLREPCQNYKRCTSVLTFDSSAPFVSSRDMIFRPIYPVYKLKCECPIGFTNDETCSDEVDMCYSHPCANGGTCVSKEGGFACVCKSQFIGERCEIDLNQGKCEQYGDVCKNGGTCADLETKGISCVCSNLDFPVSSENETTVLCELRSRHFRSGDFLMLSGITKQWHFTLSISFATTEQNGLIFYNGRLNHEHDFIALELVDGQLQLNFSTGQSWTVVDPFVEGGLNDGHWHTAEIKYYNEPKPGPLPRGVRSRNGPSSSKVVIVTVDPTTCDDVTSAHWNTTYGSYSCSKRAKQTSSKNSLDLTSPLLLGGLPELPEDYQVHSKTFQGCLRDLEIDGRTVDLAHFITNHGSLPGCSPMTSQCHSRSCYNQAQCVSVWDSVKCLCKDGYTGDRCQYQNNFVSQFSGRGCWRYIATNEIPTFKLPWQQVVSFRTYNRSAVLLYISVGLSSSLEATLKIDKGRIMYEVETSSATPQFVVLRSEVNDGEWHEVMVQWVYAHGSEPKVRVTLNLDYNRETSYREFSTSSLNQMRVNSVYVGGKVTSGRAILMPFTGCLQNIQIGSYRLTRTNLQRVGSASLRTGCAPDNTCRLDPCPRNSQCLDKWMSHECRCNKGYIGEKCVSVCSLNLCQNGGKCVLDESSPHGYRCRCPGSYHGETCQKQYAMSCPSGWFGEGLCAPCNCSSAANFASVCNNKTGECVCRKNYYYIPSTNTCSPCNCYREGSVTLQCSDTSGQCSCQRNVIGKQCNLCSSRYAEVTRSGCKVIYHKCPRSWAYNILWPETNFGMRAPEKCPGKAVGYVFRKCTKDDSWQEPNFSNCTSSGFNRIANEVNDIDTGKTSLTLPRSIEMSYDLSKTVSEAKSFYKQDLITSYQTMRTLLESESKKNGFGLAVGNDDMFTENLVQVTSTLLDNQLLQYWMPNKNNSLKMTNGHDVQLSAPRLLESWEKFTSTLLQNFNSIAYETSDADAPNMNMMTRTVSPDSLRADGFTFTNSPRDGQSSPDVEVTLPSYLFKKNKQAQLGNTTIRGDLPVVGFITYQHVNEILPTVFVVDRTFRPPRKPTVNSAVVSVLMHHNPTSKHSNGMVGSLTEPVALRFRLINTNAIEPQCIFWNFTDKSSRSPSGGWSHKGCSRASYNETHVTCHCYHLTTFAVLTDEHVSSFLEELSVFVPMVIGASISLVLLFITIAASIIFPNITSVRSVISRNLSIALFFANLLYISGIRQTSNVYLCMAVAVGLHFLLLSIFSWAFVDGLHLYRKLTERRDINQGRTTVYFIMGWIVPAIVTALSVGLDAKGYGNASFCWISMQDLLIWSFAVPAIICCITYLVLFLMSIHAFLASKRVDMDRNKLSVEMRASLCIFFSIMGTWAFATLSVNLNTRLYFYLFAITDILQGILIFLFHCLFNPEIRKGYKKFKLRSSRKSKLNVTTQQLLQPSIGRTPESSMRDGMLPRFSNSTSESMSMRSRQQQSSPMLPGDESESDLSDSYDDARSGSSISLESSSDEHQVEMNTYLNIRNTRPGYHPTTENNYLTVNHRGNGKLPSNGNSRSDEVTRTKLRFVENIDGSASDGSNETSV